VILSLALVIEVALITLQTWRAEPSHFNTKTSFDVSIELGMLGMIAIASAIIFWFTIKAWMPDQMSSTNEGMRIAMRWGMLLLVVACGLGFGITAIGKTLIAQGTTPETISPHGVLKFPHGATLHAIQTLMILAWWCDWRMSCRPIASIRFAIAAHVAWLLFAIVQTSRGKARFDLDGLALTLVCCTVILSVASVRLAVKASSQSIAEG
jgi:hypothetical protein